MWRRRRGYERHRMAALVKETWGEDRVGLAKVIVERHAVEERALRVFDDLSRRNEDVVQPIAAGRNDQHAKAALADILVLVVESNFAVPTVDVRRRADALGTAV